MAQTDADLRRRRLCPDGRCIGLVGDNDRCRECGRTVPRPVDSGSDERVPTERLMCDDESCFGIMQLISVGAPYRPAFERVCPLCGRRRPD
jgi:hypothetical protein